ncbi:hypothetical protein CRI93_04490 [Longimonas halophila]|uniref:UPF0301 protein CRI93_04490 n=1 Tax=Longimonas halophila TaxID=1469170 RepID=A0A2H3NUW9_9BACT|nr:YqgE/AlgH family protein [Longimonas halophila]PEN08377.1 hypothetical protein CRI93_04490 [Longimonas halophila]
MAHSASDLAPGSLLIAAPIMEDPNFRRTVILLCDHTSEGSFGLVLNRPTDLHLGDVMDAYFVNDPPLAFGGPVQQETLHFLHRYAEAVPESIAVLPGVRWGGTYDTIETLVQSEAPSPQSIRFFLGYTGWAPGQLQQEVNQDGWIVTEAEPEWVFETKASMLWPRVMRAMGGEYALLSTFPDDPRMN